MSNEMFPLIKTPFKFQVEDESDIVQGELTGIINNAVIKLEFYALSVTHFQVR
jgi:hypothetical protein